MHNTTQHACNTMNFMNNTTQHATQHNVHVTHPYTLAARFIAFVDFMVSCLDVQFVRVHVRVCVGGVVVCVGVYLRVRVCTCACARASCVGVYVWLCARRSVTRAVTSGRPVVRVLSKRKTICGGFSRSRDTLLEAVRASFHNLVIMNHRLPRLFSHLSARPSPPFCRPHPLSLPRHPALRKSPRLSRLSGAAFRLLLWLRLFLPARVPSVLLLLAILFT